MIQKLTYAPNVGMLPMQAGKIRSVRFGDLQVYGARIAARPVLGTRFLYVQARREAFGSAGHNARRRRRFANLSLLGHHFGEWFPSVNASLRRPCHAQNQYAYPNQRSTRQRSRGAVMHRRAFLAAAPALPLSAVSASVKTDPHPRWLCQWRAVQDAWSAAEEGSPADQALWAQFRALSDQLLFTPVATPEGAAAQLRYLVEDDHLHSLFENAGDAKGHAMVEAIVGTLVPLCRGGWVS